MKLLAVLALCACLLVVLVQARTGGQKDRHSEIDPDSNTFEQFGTVGNDGSPDDDDDASEHGPGYKLTQFVCDGPECKNPRKQTKSEQKPRQPKRASNLIQFRTVRRILHTNHESDINPELRRSKVPTVVQNSQISTQWPAFDDWRFEYFIDLWTPDYAVHPIFVSNSTLPGMGMSIVVYKNLTKETQWPNVPKPYYETAMNLGSFFSGQCGKDSPETWWWSRSLDSLEDEQIIEDTSPRDFFDRPSANHSTVSMHLTMGSRLAQMHLHYDLEDMFIVQVFRRQQILLFSPEQMRQMYLYPWTHPHARRSQVFPLTEATEEKFPGISQITGIEAILEPRDVLYIPRLWGYHIINTDPGISITVNSPNVADKPGLPGEFRRQLIRLDHLKELPQRVLAAKYAITRTLEPLLKQLDLEKQGLKKEEEEPVIADDEGYVNTNHHKTETYDPELLRNYIRHHVKQRYAKLPSYRTPEDEMTELQALKFAKKNCKLAKLDSYRLEPQTLVRLSVGLDGVSKYWSELEDSDMRQELMANYVDHLAWQAFGDHNLAAAFLRKCFL